MDSRDIEYHRNRASRELNLGLTTSCMAAARAHLRLSSLHMQRVRSLGGDDRPTGFDRPPFILA